MPCRCVSINFNHGRDAPRSIIRELNLMPLDYRAGAGFADEDGFVAGIAVWIIGLAHVLYEGARFVSFDQVDCTTAEAGAGETGAEGAVFERELHEAVQFRAGDFEIVTGAHLALIHQAPELSGVPPHGGF